VNLDHQNLYMRSRSRDIVMKAATMLCGTLASASFASVRQEQGVPLTSIAPKQVQAEFSLKNSTKPWADHLYSPSNKKLYDLSLEPEVSVAKHVIGVDLVLRNADNLKTDENLLRPAGNWHGLQPYNFVATDLMHGADKSVFGLRRSIKVTTKKLTVVIQILDEKIRALPDGTQEIDDLKLAISVDNLPNS
jgi:hypothetical protein